jgi:hypothetical protein
MKLTLGRLALVASTQQNLKQSILRLSISMANAERTIDKAGNTKGGSIIVPLDSRLTGLESVV